MPPRKSNVSHVSEDGAKDDHAPVGATKIDDYQLPKSMVQRLAKGALPGNTPMSKDAQTAISKSATVFVNYLAAHANEQAQRMNKKTIQPKDVLDAIVDIEFPFFLERLDAELQKYNAVQCDKRNSYRRKVREEQKTKSAAALAEAGLGPDAAEAGAGGKQGEEKKTVGTNGVPNITSPKRDEGEPSAKRVKGDDGAQVEDEDEEEDAPDEPEEEPQEDEAEVEEEEEDEDEAEEQFEDAKEDLAEDFLEERQGRDEDMEDEALDDGNDSD